METNFIDKIDVSGRRTVIRSAGVPKRTGISECRPVAYDGRAVCCRRDKQVVSKRERGVTLRILPRDAMLHSTVNAVVVCCPTVRPSQVGVLMEYLNVESSSIQHNGVL